MFRIFWCLLLVFCTCHLLGSMSALPDVPASPASVCMHTHAHPPSSPCALTQTYTETPHGHMPYTHSPPLTHIHTYIDTVHPHAFSTRTALRTTYMSHKHVYPNKHSIPFTLLYAYSLEVSLSDVTAAVAPSTLLPQCLWTCTQDPPEERVICLKGKSKFGSPYLVPT